MSKCYLICSILFICSYAVAQEPAVSYGEKMKLYSTHLNDTVETYIYLPEDYDRSIATYPVIYLLDGKYYYPLVSQAVKILAESSTIPPSIVVAIRSKNRDRDYTTPLLKGFTPPMPMPDAGGVDNFLSFLQKELATAIEKKYRVSNYRIILGHSLGGLVAMYSLYKTPGFYKAHIVVDASLWWNDGEVGKAAINFFKSNSGYKGKLIWVRDKIPHEVWFPINIEMHDYLTAKKPVGLQFTFKELEDETHSTVIFPGAYMGIKNIFSSYRYPFSETTTVSEFKTYYDSLSTEFGFEIFPSENAYHNLMFMMMHFTKNDKATEAGELWMKNYPMSAWVYESMAELYLKIGNKSKAILYINKALEHDAERSSAKKLKDKLQ